MKSKTRGGWLAKNGSSLLLCLAACPLLAMLYALTSQRLVNPDVFLYAQCAKEFLHGRRLYGQAWQDRPPIALRWYAVPQLFASRSYAAIQAFLGIWLVLQAMLFVLWSGASRMARLACFVFVTLFPLTFWDYAWASTEHAANLFVSVNLLLGYAMYRRGEARAGMLVGVGIASCLAFHARQSTILSMAIPLWAALRLAPRSLAKSGRVILWIGVGGFATWGAILALILARGDLGGYFYTTFTYVHLFAAQQTSDSQLMLVLGVFTTPLPIIAFLFFIIAFGRNRTLAVLLFIIGAMSVLTSPRDHPHYWVQVFPYVTMLICMALARAEPNAGPWPAAAVMALIFGVISACGAFLNACFNLETRQALDQVLTTAAAQAHDGDRLFVLGSRIPASYLQFASALPAANTYFCCWQLDAPFCDVMPRPLATIEASYMANPPDILLIEDPYWSDLVGPPANRPAELTNSEQLTLQLLKANRYEPVAKLKHYVILHRIGPARAAAGR